ncbi:hypothetical protein Hypma_013672 [Hypsizygus marmoreus]|uniref:Uncharacterized protein n=1 Tax=Hypsizygus marmoreus TaxID=39966 RepID=A0A369JKN8_HYPMA|nr:hypothetical protein Hypma_013672 [Hypsizygus marmoreus]
MPCNEGSGTSGKNLRACSDCPTLRWRRRPLGKFQQSDSGLEIFIGLKTRRTRSARRRVLITEHEHSKWRESTVWEEDTPTEYGDGGGGVPKIAK